MSHPWRSSGEKRTITWSYEPEEQTLQYLSDMRDAVRYALQIAFFLTVRDPNRKIPSPVALRREVKGWFGGRYGYARHHVNPVCRAAVAMLRSYRKNHRGKLAVPDAERLAMRVDGELFRIAADQIRLTLQPNHYAWLPLNTSNKHYQEYARGRPSELLITDHKMCLTFVVGDETKPVGSRLIGSDLNFNTIDTTTTTTRKPALENVETLPTAKIARIQNDFIRRRRQIQLHVHNSQKRDRKLAETRGRQRNRVKDALQKLSTKTVRQNPDSSHVFENLKGIRKSGTGKGRKFRTRLNRWPYRLYQSMVEYKSPNRTLYVNPRGTSSECPVCGGKLKHPAWGISRCDTCGADYDRNRLSSLEIVSRGLRLCGQPFAVSADASWKAMKNEYLHAGAEPKATGPGRTKPTNAPNESTHNTT